MGNEIARNDGKLLKPPVGTADTPAGGTDKRDSRTATPRTPSGGGSGNTPAGGTATRTQEEKKPSGLAPVKTPETVEGVPAPAAPQKQAKRKKAPSKKKAPETGFNAEQISALLISVSTIAAAREGFQMFALTEIEAMQIATPLANMIQKSEQLSKLGEYSDGIALVTACIVVMAPRLMMYFDMQKKKKLAANGGMKIVKQEAKSMGGNSGTSKPDSRPVQHDPEITSSAIPAFI